MALAGHQIRVEQIQLKITEIQQALETRPSRLARAVQSDGARPKGKMSPAAKKRIAAAQKKRWAAFHASKTEATKPEAKPVSKKTAPAPTPRKKLSAARKAALVANLKKARAAQPKGRRAKRFRFSVQDLHNESDSRSG
jgi:hypothetical protein